MAESPDLKEQLRAMDEQLLALIAMADAQLDSFLAALLCEAHERVMQRYIHIRPT